VDVDAPLTGVRILDFSTLLPGPLATLMLADAGADVIKIERPGLGDEVRSYSPKIGDSSAIHALLNRGKRAFAADLGEESDHRRVLQLAARAQVVVEQFRPGVADRLGIGYDQLHTVNPGVVYCSISGYGQHSELRDRAGHDLNYLAQSGLLGVVTDTAGSPALPVSNLADIAGGSYPAALNILLGLRRSEATGLGCHLDISMTHNLQVLAFANLASRRAGATVEPRSSRGESRPRGTSCRRQRALGVKGSRAVRRWVIVRPTLATTVPFAENLVRPRGSRCAGCARFSAHPLEGVLSSGMVTSPPDGRSCCCVWRT
jgi:crotonobetainyl-CoA:carnitine CoA-transferase CaiB-like acyl-CoA transferase